LSTLVGGVDTSPSSASGSRTLPIRGLDGLCLQSHVLTYLYTPRSPFKQRQGAARVLSTDVCGPSGLCARMTCVPSGAPGIGFCGDSPFCAKNSCPIDGECVKCPGGRASTEVRAVGGSGASACIIPGTRQPHTSHPRPGRSVISFMCAHIPSHASSAPDTTAGAAGALHGCVRPEWPVHPGDLCPLWGPGHRLLRRGQPILPPRSMSYGWSVRQVPRRPRVGRGAHGWRQVGPASRHGGSPWVMIRWA
jgi:hypothetical protein